MRFLVIILALGFLVLPRQENYPPELAPIPNFGPMLRVLGFPIPLDEPIEHIEGDVVTVDILVALASTVTSSVCQQGINRINLTADNSGVATAQTRLVRCLPTTYISSGNVQTDLLRLQIANDGFLDNVHTERNLVFADTVVLVVKATAACGIAYLNASPGSAFAVVAEGCMTNSSFEHEWGHNVGMAHDTANAGNLAYSYGVGWCFGNGFKDVLTYPSPCGGIRAAFYSNPDIIYQGRQTGTATANNARVLRERIAVLAGFRINPNVSSTTNHLR